MIKDMERGAMSSNQVNSGDEAQETQFPTPVVTCALGGSHQPTTQKILQPGLEHRALRPPQHRHHQVWGTKAPRAGDETVHSGRICAVRQPEELWTQEEETHGGQTDRDSRRQTQTNADSGLERGQRPREKQTDRLGDYKDLERGGQTLNTEARKDRVNQRGDIQRSPSPTQPGAPDMQASRCWAFGQST